MGYSSQASDDTADGGTIGFEGTGEEPTAPLPRRTLWFLIVCVFLSSLGVGIVTPVEPFIVQRYVSAPGDLAAVVGWLTAVYSLCVFLAAPGLGALSDRFGRRPVLLASLLGSALGYLLFGAGGALWVLFVSRCLDGLTGANVSVVFAYVADAAEPREYGRLFGTIGAALGVGFIVGPALGGLAGLISAQAPVYLAAAVCAVALLWGYRYLPESLSPSRRASSFTMSQLNPLVQFRQLAALPALRWLLVIIFLVACPFGALQAILAVFAKGAFHWNALLIGGLLVLVGVIGVVIEGGALQRLQPRFGDLRLALTGILFMLASYTLLGLAALTLSVGALIAGTLCIACGDGLLRPTLGALLAHAAGSEKQGQAQGANESAQSLATTVGPAWGGLMYSRVGRASPFLLSVGIVGLALVLLFQRRGQAKLPSAAT